MVNAEMKFIESIARMTTYEPHPVEGHSLEQADDAITCMNSLIEQARKIFGPDVKLTKGGKLRCPHCKKLNTPNLIERGYDITHEVRSIRGMDMVATATNLYQMLTARGGGSEDFSEEGGDYRLECPNCFSNFAMPVGLEVEFV